MSSDVNDRPSAGDRKGFFGGSKRYLSPKPLPSGYPAIDFANIVAKVTPEILEVGLSRPSVFGWQLIIGAPLMLLFLINLVMPYSVYFMALLGGTGHGYAYSFVDHFYSELAWVAYLVCSFIFIAGLSAVYKRIGQFSTMPRILLHRQRREVCYVSFDQEAPIYEPWESLVSWVIEAKAVSEYGVQRHSGFGIGVHDSQTGEIRTLESQTVVQSFGISSWEAIRSYMEYEVDSLDEIKPEAGQDAEAGEGVEHFRRARATVHEEFRDGKVSGFYLMGWYLYHLFALWTVPNRLVELEEALIAKRGGRKIPEEVQKWSKPIPKGECTCASNDLIAQSKRVAELREQQPDRPIFDIFAQVSAEFGQKEPTVKANSG